MATAALLCSEYLRCPVCLDLFREPVTIPCGHTFCMGCITQCWSLQGALTSCPQCRCSFCPDPQPRLCKNSILSQMVEDFSNTHKYSDKLTMYPAGNTELPIKNEHQHATPEADLREGSVDSGSPECTNPCGSLLRQRRAVSQAFSDMVRILQSSGFRLLQLMDQSESGVLEQVGREAVEEGLTMDTRHNAQVVPDGQQEPLMSLELEMSSEEEQVWDRLPMAVSKFKESLVKLCADHMGRMAQQVWTTRASCLPPSTELWRSPLMPLIPRVRADFLQYLQDISLDPETAHHNLSLMQGNRRVLCKLQPQAYPEHPGRFDHYTQVLGREPLGQGRHYWEVHLSGSRVSLGVSYHGISRKGHQSHCLAGRNSHSWCLEWSSSRCCAWHDGQRVLVAVGQQERLGVFLDWDAGSLSFHEISDEMPLLHRFRASFIQPVYPIFFISWNSAVSIGIEHTTKQFIMNKRFHRQLSANF
ncbi:E3 ubiquitin-protein ligase TRIM47-like [Pelobates fuscus]|uniref:E3 ubiquitin-protein ligase TRIM47-like n=1 Tax=Pelobates fuscus TaxID=191477 RepID=UPI002FE4533C